MEERRINANATATATARQFSRTLVRSLVVVGLLTLSSLESISEALLVTWKNMQMEI